MRKRIGSGLAAVVAGLTVLTAMLGQTAAQDKGKGPTPKLLYGHDLRVRPGGEKDWPKARRFGLEVFQDEATKAGIGITEDGYVSVFPAGALGEKKEFQYLTGLDMSVRKAGEKEFTQRTQKFGVELFRDLRSNRLVYGCQTGSVAFAPVPGSLVQEKGPKWHHALETKVRLPDQERFDDAKRFGLEVYKDENTGGLIYITETGAISTAAAPATAPEKNKILPPKHVYGLILLVRRSDEPDFDAEKTRKVVVEVFEDPNAGTLFYLTDTGSIAVVAKPEKYLEGKGVNWKTSWNLTARKAGEKGFDKARKYGVEVFEDVKTGNLIFVTETGAAAVLPK